MARHGVQVDGRVTFDGHIAGEVTFVRSVSENRVTFEQRKNFDAPLRVRHGGLFDGGVTFEMTCLLRHHSEAGKAVKLTKGDFQNEGDF